MLEILTGAGLATSAGLNAFIPVLALGLLDRFTNLADLPPAWSWLSSDVSLWILGVLLVVGLLLALRFRRGRRARAGQHTA